jgi:hypothetical protein
VPWVWLAIGGTLVVAALVIIGALVLQPGAAGSTPAAPVSRIGQVQGCRRVPRFAAAQGFRSATFSTEDRAVVGLKMVDGADPSRVYRHPSWSSAGSLGPVLADGQGNIYVAPVPRINLLDNPPELQNRIYRVDSASGEMSLYADLPAAAPPTPENVYGVLGLALDCETNSLYATSVAGSTRSEERGRIFRVDLGSGVVTSTFDGVDAIGVGVFNTARGKRLYFGPARVSEIRSVALDAAGNFTGEERVELPLTAPGASGTDRARRITFTDAGEMQVNGRQFDFNMVANTLQPRLLYVFQYQLADDSWKFVSYTPN